MSEHASGDTNVQKAVSELLEDNADDAGAGGGDAGENCEAAGDVSCPEDEQVAGRRKGRAIGMTSRVEIFAK